MLPHFLLLPPQPATYLTFCFFLVFCFFIPIKFLVNISNTFITFYWHIRVGHSYNTLNSIVDHICSKNYDDISNTLNELYYMTWMVWLK